MPCGACGQHGHNGRTCTASASMKKNYRQEQARIYAEKKANEKRRKAEIRAEKKRLKAEKKAERELHKAEKKAEKKRLKAKMRAEEERRRNLKMIEDHFILSRERRFWPSIQSPSTVIFSPRNTVKIIPSPIIENCFEVITDCAVFKGHLVNGKPEGEGSIVWDNCEKYNGNWKDGEKHGQGHDYFISDYFWPQYEIFQYNYGEYEGTFSEGFRQGSGIMKYYDGGVYEGSWHKDMRCGHGKMDLSLGINQLYLTYEGQWGDDHIQGMGTMIYCDGSKFEGEWRCGSPWKGKYTKANGEIIKGEWDFDDHRPWLFADGKFEITDTNGNIRIAIYSGGEEDKNASEKAMKINALTDDCCPICHEDIYEQLTITKCGHAFHTECLFKCFQHNETCPMCRAPLISD